MSPRDTLLDAALRLLPERTAEGLRVRDVAAAAQVSTMGVYTHFGSKQGLLEALYRQGFVMLGDRLRDLPAAEDHRAGLLAFALAYRSFALDHEALYALMFERASPDFTPSDDSRRAGLETLGLLAARLRAWRPEAPGTDADAHLLWAAMHGLVSIELMHRRWGGPLMPHLDGDPARTFTAALGVVLEGLAPR